MRLSDALEVLGEAMTGAGVPLWSAPESLRDVEAFQTEISPMRLLAELVEFWQQVDVRTLAVEPYPRFTTPEFSFGDWLAHIAALSWPTGDRDAVCRALTASTARV